MTQNIMYSQRLVVGLLLFTCATTAMAQSTVDRIRRRSGVDTGQIKDVSALAVTISKGGVESKIPVEEIRQIDFGGEPSEMATARSALQRGRFDDALESLEKIEREKIQRPEILQEVEFLVVQCQAGAAFAGEGSFDRAIKAATAFVTQNRNSYRVPGTIELLGDLYLANRQEDEARAQYAKLAKAPAPYFQARSAILLGKLLQHQDKHQEAVGEFDRALAAAKGNPTAESLELEATLHRAISASAAGDVEAATAVVNEIIAKADAEDVELLATAYNALGDCYLQSEKPKAARDAFLHVDILFSSAADEHAKALYELSRLWETLGQPQRAREARTRLQEEYPSSPWLRK